MTQLQKVRVPGIVWAALLVGIAWFLAANFPEEIWYPVAIIAITAVVKYIEIRMVNVLPLATLPPGNQTRALDKDAQQPDASVDQHRIRRWLIE